MIDSANENKIVRGRIKDLRMYLALLWGIIEEEEQGTFKSELIAGSITTHILFIFGQKD